MENFILNSYCISSVGTDVSREYIYTTTVVYMDSNKIEMLFKTSTFEIEV